MAARELCEANFVSEQSGVGLGGKERAKEQEVCTMTTCEQCGNEAMEDDVYCRQCGEELASNTLTCECGADVLPDDNYCHQCGAAFTGTVEEDEHHEEEEGDEPDDEDTEEESDTPAPIF